MLATAKRVGCTVAFVCGAVSLAPAAWAVSPADRCEAAKLNIAGRHGLCRLQAEARAVKSGDPVDYSRCDNTFALRWEKAETAAAGVCPTNGDQVGIGSHIAAVTDLIALRVAGARFVDNGNGTVTDTQTRLTWEKKDDAGGLHDRDNLYTWTDAMTVFLAEVNGLSSNGTAQTGLGGYNDWRLPSNAELQSILLAPHPCATNPCIDPTFGPTASTFHWSSTRDTTHPTFSWGLFFNTGLVENDEWSKDYSARAVRGAP